jgi:uncharacterized membrane protein YjjP (DUF1212 family)
MTDAVEPAILGRFLLGVAQGMNASGESVDRTRETLTSVAAAYGREDADFVVLPTVVLIETGSGDDTRVAMSSAINATFRFDQIAALYALIARARRGEVDPGDGIAELNRIGGMRPRFGWFVRTLGHAVLTTGLALLLVPTWQGVVLAFLLGGAIGAIKLVRSSTLQLILPVAVAFCCAVTVFLLAEVIAIGDPIHVLIAPLVTFLPGGVLTTATVELAGGQMVAGASRLVYGFVQLALLAFGILVGGTVVGVDAESYRPIDASGGLPWWVPLGGVVVFAVGNYLHFSAPASTFGWVCLVLVIAYAAQVAGTALAGPTVGAFTGALAMTPVVLWISEIRHGAPSQLTFLPAFWLLVPGAAGLVGLTEAVAEGAATDLVAALVSVVSIALGVLIGTALHRVVSRGAMEMEQFVVEMPTEALRRASRRRGGRLSAWLRRGGRRRSRPRGADDP